MDSHGDPYKMVGSVWLGKYRIERFLGRRELSDVYEGRHLGIDKHVIIKILKPEHARGNDAIVARFEREAKVAAQLSHENSVNVLDAGRTDDGLIYLVMEWVEGWSLMDEMLRKGPFSIDRTNEILRQLASALDTSHDAGLIHGDVKLDNILITKRRDGSDRVVLLDWGIGRAIEQDEDFDTASQLSGTPLYMSPEMFTGAPLDHRTDIYSLGVVVYEMLTGNPPFDAADFGGMVRKKLTGQSPAVSDSRPDVPAAIDDLVGRMLAADREQRPRRAGDAADLFNTAVKRAGEAADGSPPPRVFISYAREDEPRAQAVYGVLKARGFRPWLDKHALLPGSDWEAEIKRNLKESDFLIVCLSAKSLSKRGYVQKELRMALDLAEELPFGSIFLIPVRFDECTVPDPLSKYHYVDWYSDDGAERVIQAINVEWLGRHDGA